MSYVDGLSATLADMGQIESTLAALPSTTSAGGFGAVLAEVASLSSASPGASSSGGPAGSGTAGAGTGAGAGAGSELPGGFGWPLEEGRPLPGADATATAGQSPLASVLRTVSGTSGAGTTGAGVSGLGVSGLGVSGLGMGGLGVSTSMNLGEQAVSEAQKFLGVPYLWGGTNPSVGVDCSGLVQDVYKALGISLPRTSEQQAATGVAVPSVADAQPGDLVFFPGSDGTAAAPGHVGIYIGNGEMIDAPYTGAKVRVDPVGNPTQIRRVTGLGVAVGAYAAYQSPAVQVASGGATSGSTPYQADFASAASTYGVPDKLLSAVADTESGYQPSAVSGAGAEGLMQLMPSTATSLGVNPFDPAQAIPAAAQLLSAYYAKYGSWPLALAAYNAGPAAVDQYSGIPPYPQTQAYVQTVMARAGMEA
jgi:cell wall-associated NlpC family hydrolase